MKFTLCVYEMKKMVAPCFFCIGSLPLCEMNVHFPDMKMFKKANLEVYHDFRKYGFFINETQSPSWTKQQKFKRWWSDFWSNLRRRKTYELDYLSSIITKYYFRVWRSIILEKWIASPWTDTISSEMFIEVYH